MRAPPASSVKVRLVDQELDDSFALRIFELNQVGTGLRRTIQWSISFGYEKPSANLYVSVWTDDGWKNALMLGTSQLHVPSRQNNSANLLPSDFRQDEDRALRTVVKILYGADAEPVREEEL